MTTELIIIHIDAPDNYSPYWHYHDFTSDPGNPNIGHRGKGGHPAIGDGTLQGLINFLIGSGFDDPSLNELGLG